MLRSLNVRGFALLEDVRVDFDRGLNVVTGETGAGKSLLVGALAFLLGDRADASRLRAGASEATVEGIFELAPGPSRDEIAALLEEKTGSAPEDGIVALSRVLDLQGRARAYANNRYLTRDSLREIASRVITLHGQKENSSLARPATQRDKLDAYCGLLGERERFARARAETLAIYKELKELRRAERERLDRLDLLRFQTQEIKGAQLREGELARLALEFQTLSSAERIRGIVALHLEALHEADGSSLERLAAARRAFEELRSVAPALAAPAERLEEARLLADDAVTEARRFVEALDSDPAKLAAASDRIDKIQRILDRFHVDEAGALSLLSKMEEETAALENASVRTAELEAALAAKLQHLQKLGERLTSSREKSAPDLAKEVAKTLAGLGMERAQFRVRLSAREESPNDSDEPLELARSSEAGFDTILFELAPNPGEAFLPLGEVASGGELARVALAIESACADVATIPTILFDEIDENVGGRLGPALGGYLLRTAKAKQVFVVTHLAGVAAHADRHLWVSKEVRGERTHTEVRAIEGEARVAELAAMMSGDAESAAARADAKALLAAARGDATKTSRGEITPVARRNGAARRKDSPSARPRPSRRA
jgi:DNA repair protein RecN (Recombination protein N)